MLQKVIPCVATRRLVRGAWSIGIAPVHFEALEARTLMTVTVTDLDPSRLDPSKLPGYAQGYVEVEGYNDPVDGLVGIGVYLKADHDELFTSKIGSFKDADAGAASDYRATVRLDDQTTMSAMVVRNTAGGFDVMASAGLTWGWHALKVNVTDLRTPTRGTRFDSAAFVVAPAISGEAVSLQVKAGKVFDGVIAKYAGLDPDLLNEYDISVDWGDGERGVGTVEMLDDSSGAIRGRHTYTTPGLHDITVYLTTRSATTMPTLESGGIRWGARTDGQSSRGTWHVSALTVDGSWQPGRASNGAAPRIEARSQIKVSKADLVGDTDRFSLVATNGAEKTMARFDILLSQFGDLSNYKGFVDVTPPARYDAATGTVTPRAMITVPGTLSIDANGKLVVSIDRAFTAVGNHAYAVRIQDVRKSGDDAQVGLARGQFDVNQPIRIDVNETLTAEGGVPVTQAIARITLDKESGWTDALDVFAKLWIDNESQIIPVRLVSAGVNAYDVYIDFTPAQTRSVGRFVVDVFASLDRRSTASAGAASDGKYEAAGSRDVVYRPESYAGFEFDSERSRYLGRDGTATNDVGYHARIDEDGYYFRLGKGVVGSEQFSADDFTAMIQWSDGSTSPIELDRSNEYYGNITDKGVHRDVMARTFVASAVVQGTHRGIESGMIVLFSQGQRTEIPIRVEFNDQPYGSAPVATASIGTVMTQTFTATRGQDWQGVLGTFRPEDPNARFEDFTIGLYLEGVKVDAYFELGSGGEWNIVAGFNFSHETKADRDGGSRTTGTISLGVANASGQQAYAISAERYRVDIDNTKLNAAGESKSIRQFEEVTTTLARFDAPVGGSVADFRAVIDWGDGTTSDGVISERYRGGWDVTGSHKYRVKGQFNPVVTISRGSEYTRTRASLFVAHHPVDVTPDAPATSGLTVNGTIATFVDGDLLGTIDLDQVRIKHAALIDWGDGTVTTGDLVQLANGTYAVEGSHTYAASGNYTVSVTVRQNAINLPNINPWLDYADGVSGDAYQLSDASSSNRPTLIASALFTLSVRENERQVFGFASADPREVEGDARMGMASLTRLLSDDNVLGSTRDEDDLILVEI